MKINKQVVCIFGCSLLLTSLFGCSQAPNLSAKLSYEKDINGQYFIKYQKDGKEVNTHLGSMGAMFGDKEMSALQTKGVHNNYTSVESTEFGLLAKGKVLSSNGSEIAFTDAFNIIDEFNETKIQVNRHFEVTSASKDDYGFFISQKWSQVDKFTIEDKDWFIPSTHYVTGQHTLSNSSTRMYCGGNEFCIAGDEVSALLVSSLREGYAFSMMDVTPGQRETIVEECNTRSKIVLNVSDVFNIPGIVVSCDTDLENVDDEDISLDDEGFVSYSHIYPAYINRAKENYNYRLLPVEEGLSRNLSFTISLDKYNSFYELQEDQWLRAFRHYEIEEKRYPYNEVFESLISYVDKSHSWYDKDKTDSILPIYMDNCVHKHPDSGFLYRNIDLAYYMIKYALEQDVVDVGMIHRASATANNQVEYDRIDYTMYGYPRDYTCFKRALFDGLSSAVNLYVLLNKYPSNATEVDIVKLHDYILQKAELYKDDTSAMALTFYAQLVRNKTLLNVDYSSTYKRLLDGVIKSTKDFGGYYGAIENQTNVRFSSMEDYMIILRALVNGYELFSSQQYLNEAVRIANYLETYNQLQPINLSPVGCNGGEGLKYAFMGNERFLANGYAFNNTNHKIYDIADNSSVIEYYKLAKYTGNTHYEDFLRMKLTNALSYINMGDKVGQMDDPKMSSDRDGNYGFMNEFCGVSVASDSKPDAGGRGSVHDAVIGWNVYEIISTLDFLKDEHYKAMFDDDLNHNLAINKKISIDEDNVICPIYNVIDEYKKTYYSSNKATYFVMDLNEQCVINKINIEGSYNVQYLISSDGETFTSFSSGIKGRYIKFTLPAYEKISNIEVIGHAVRYVDLGLEATSFGLENALDQSNYTTIWNPSINSSGKSINEITLRNLSEVYVIAIKPTFDWEYPSDDNACPRVTPLKYRVEVAGEDKHYYLYGEDDGSVAKFVYVTSKFAKVKYVRITIDSSTLVGIGDIKILGSEI